MSIDRIATGSLPAASNQDSRAMVTRDGSDAFDVATGSGSAKNLVLSDGTNWLSVASTAFPPGHCEVTHSANQSISNSTITTLAFDTESYDYGACHDTVTNNSRLTAPYDGVYFVGGIIRWAAHATGRRIMYLYKNGVLTNYRVDEQTSVAAQLGLPFGAFSGISLNATDYMEAKVWQNSGGGLNVQAAGTYFAMHLLRRE